MNCFVETSQPANGSCIDCTSSSVMNYKESRNICTKSPIMATQPIDQSRPSAISKRDCNLGPVVRPQRVPASSRNAYNEELLRQLQNSARIITKLKSVIEDANVECVQVTEELHKLALDSSSQLPPDEQQTKSELPKSDAEATDNHEKEPISSAKLSLNSEDSLAALDQSKLPATGSEEVTKVDCDLSVSSDNLDDSFTYERFLAVEQKVSSLKCRLVELEEMKLRCEAEWIHRRETVATDVRVVRGLVLSLRPAHQEATPSKDSLVQLLEECDGQLEELRSQHSALDAFFAGLDRRLMSTDAASSTSSPDDSQGGTGARGWGHLELQLSPSGSGGLPEDGTLFDEGCENATEEADKNKNITLANKNNTKQEAVAITGQSDRKQDGGAEHKAVAVLASSSTKQDDGAEDKTVAVQRPSRRMRRLVAVMSGAATTVNGLLAIMSGAAVTFHGIVGATTSTAGTVAGAVGVANGALVTLNGLAGAVGGAAATLTGRVGLMRGAAGTINGLAGTVAGTAGMISGAVGAASSTAGSFGAMVSIIRGGAGTLGGVVGVVRGTASSISAAFTDLT